MIKKSKYFVLLFLLIVGSGCSDELVEAVEAGKNRVLQAKNKVWEASETIRLDVPSEVPEQAMIQHVPFIRQLPELERGCEVTSLAMLLQYGGAAVDKLMLAKEIAWVPFEQHGKRGNPNQGFVGDMYTIDNPGYGVYHQPVFELAQKYMGHNVIDLTGRDITDIYRAVSKGSPVWVITNATFTPLAGSEFQTWHTNAGDIQITYHEHSVVIVGYDEENVYINDPLADSPNSAVPRTAFEQAWEQMGKQAITLLPS